MFKMNERDWKIVKALSEFKNITNTAKNLGISQPALTSRIKKLEENLGVELLTRSNKGVNLTPEGAYVAEFAVKVLAALESFKSGLNEVHAREEAVRKQAELEAAKVKAEAVVPELSAK